MYSIKAVSSMTGLNVETLRAWERRYQVVEPRRDHNGRRVYSESEIELLTLLNLARQQGHSISKMAVLPVEQLKALIKAKNDPQLETFSELQKMVVAGLKRYEISSCENLLRKALISMSPLEFSQQFLSPLLQSVGQLWHLGEITIAQEHLFSECVKRLVLSWTNNMNFNSGNVGKIIFTTPTGEQHEFGILLSCLIAASQGFECYYLGPDLPYGEIINAQKQLQANIILLSLINTPVASDTSEQLSCLVEKLTSNSELWIGGAGAKHLKESGTIDKSFHYISDLSHLNMRLNHQAIHGQSSP